MLRRRKTASTRPALAFMLLSIFRFNVHTPFFFLGLGVYSAVAHLRRAAQTSHPRSMAEFVSFDRDYLGWRTCIQASITSFQPGSCVLISIGFGSVSCSR